jgi:5-methyltetrahydropteroyltriglutamate--homocysteine methyltransferase
MDDLHYRADHVGSFLKVPEAVAARREGRGVEHLRDRIDRAILDVLERQQELGFRIFTDGELRRRNFTGDFFEAVEGFGAGDAVLRSWQGGSALQQHSGALGAVHARLRQRTRLTAHELPFLHAHAPGAIKMTVPSATQFPAQVYRKGVTDAVYRDRSELLADIREIIANELAALAAEGVPYIQLDAPRYSYYVDPKWRDWLRTEMEAEPETLLAESLATDNACFRAARAANPNVVLAIHLCRGNNRSQWYAEGGYDAIAERLFSTLDVDRFLLEYDDERSGSFAPLRFVPKDKTVVLGLVSTKRPPLEDPEVLRRRIDDAAKIVPLERLALSPQCGFASSLEGNVIGEAEQWAKMGLVAETARAVWGET